MRSSERFLWRDNFHQELIHFLCTDFAGITRGRAFPKQDLPAKMKSGVGWVPVNQTITAFDDIPECPYWGAHGDLRLLPDPNTKTHVNLELGGSPLHFYLCNMVELDGRPWDLCTRSFLLEAVKRFSASTGCEITAAFEHEFAFIDSAEPDRPGFSYRRFRDAEPFGTLLMTALAQAGQEPEMFLPEFGAAQFEFTCKPTKALHAADRAVIAREITHEVAKQTGRILTFSPKVSAEGVSNGVHIHVSVRDKRGSSVFYDSGRDGCLSEFGGMFAAGVIHYLPAILAFTAPSVISYRRLIPHQWSAAYACLGNKNRESSLRICPFDSFSGNSPAAQFNLEYRACDATANPYLALAALILAGLEGIEQKLSTPPLINDDPDELDEPQREKLNIRRLPVTLHDALAKMAESETVCSWFSQRFLNSYRAVKHSEIEKVKDDDIGLYRRYTNIY